MCLMEGRNGRAKLIFQQCDEEEKRHELNRYPVTVSRMMHILSPLFLNCV